jgi:hypothetical protein
MRRRSRVSSEPTKARRHKAKSLKAARHSNSSVADQETEVVRLRRELDDAQEQQTATAEVLKIISTSPTELRPVPEVVVRSAARYCKADDVTLFELDGQDRGSAPRWAASRNHTSASPAEYELFPPLAGVSEAVLDTRNDPSISDEATGTPIEASFQAKG